ncbi:MAG: hypothetical protein QOI36_4737, partial [Pseudonocardiales bacterium]|nr:hypothetical protein [Pseudonocardiales bacterium]
MQAVGRVNQMAASSGSRASVARCGQGSERGSGAALDRRCPQPELERPVGSGRLQQLLHVLDLLG